MRLEAHLGGQGAATAGQDDMHFSIKGR